MNTKVKIGTKFCTITSVSSSQITCITPLYSAGNFSVSITSNNISFPSTSFIYNSSLTPNVTQISPSSGNFNQLVNIYGSGFGKSISKISKLTKLNNINQTVLLDGVNVFIGDSQCNVQNITDNQIQCTTGVNYARSYPILVQVIANGYSNTNVNFTYNLSLASISSNQSMNFKIE